MKKPNKKGKQLIPLSDLSPGYNISKQFDSTFIQLNSLVEVSINKFDCILLHGGFIDRKEGKIFLTLLTITRKDQSDILIRLKNFQLIGAGNILTFYLDNKNKIIIQHCMPLKWKTEKNYITVEFFFCKDEKELQEYLLNYGISRRGSI